MQKYALLSAVAIIIIVWSSGAARAAEVTLIAPGGIRAAVQQMIPAFERATGHKVEATFGSGGGTKERGHQEVSRSTCPSCNRHWSP